MRWNKSWVLLLPLCFIGCQSTTHPVAELQEEMKAQEKTQIAPTLSIDALDFYSTYMSDAAMASCKSKTTECVEDPLEAQLWFEVLQSSLAPTTLGSGDNSTSDYEILVASQLRKIKPDAPIQKALASVYLAPDVKTVDSIHTEFTVQWRGFALDTHSTSTALKQIQSARQQAEEMVTRWKNHASSIGVFSRDFLYSTLRASDYRQELVVPSQLGEFYLEDTQLYADPFRGAVSRYRHPMFENAILDITVSPILAALTSADGQWLKTELSRDLQRAEQVAQTRQMQLTVEMPITTLTTSQTQGHYFSVRADDEFDEPLYAATYLFKRKDKLVKFTSSFPHHVAEPLVIEALATMQVPGQSALMQEVRAMF